MELVYVILGALFLAVVIDTVHHLWTKEKGK